MPHSTNEFLYSGGDPLFPVNFSLGYLSKADVGVYVKGELDGSGQQLYRTFTWVGDSNVRLDAAPTPPATVVVERTVSKTQLLIDTATSDVTRDSIARAFRHQMMAFHEVVDGRTNLGDALEQIAEDSIVGAISAAQQAQVSATTAAASATAAAGHATAAQTHSANAQAANTSANNSKNAAANSATTAGNHATAAAGHATAAQTHSANAQTAATSANNSKNNAATSETNAAASAAAALSSKNAAASSASAAAVSEANTSALLGSVSNRFSNVVFLADYGATPASPAAASANLTALQTAINTVHSRGGGTVLVSGMYFLSGQVNLATVARVTVAGVTRGSGFFCTSGFSGSSVFSLGGFYNTIEDLEINGLSMSGVGQWVSAITMYTTAWYCAVRRCRMMNFSFCGIHAANTLPAVHQHVYVEDNYVNNVGWMHITFGETTDLYILRNTCVSSGNTGIWLDDNCTRVWIDKNYVTKATPPYRVYDGPGSIPGGQESGFLIGRSPTSSYVWITDNYCLDNRNAGGDGIGLGETGAEHGPCFVDNNTVELAGLFGIDVASRSTVTNNRVIGAAQCGIFMSYDLGGSISRAVVKGNQIDACNGPYAINISSNMGNPLSISDCVISDNIVTDYRATPATQYGIRVHSTNVTVDTLMIANNIALHVGTAGILLSGTGSVTRLIQSNNIFK